MGLASFKFKAQYKHRMQFLKQFDTQILNFKIKGHVLMHEFHIDLFFAKNIVKAVYKTIHKSYNTLLCNKI